MTMTDLPPSANLNPRPKRDAASLAHRAEYGALRATLAALEMIGWRHATAVGEKIGALGYSPLRVRRSVVERQIAAAFPGLGDVEVARIARASYRHLGRVTIEAALLPTLPPEAVLDLFEGTDGWDALVDAAALGRGVIVVTGHLGNWELAGSYVAARGYRVDAIARGMANPLFDRYLTAVREHIGMTVVHDQAAVRRTPRSLREGRLVAFLFDQGAVGLASTFVPFFGRWAKTPRGPAVFALRLDVPVVFGAAIRQPSGKYRLIFEPVAVTRTGDREHDVDMLVAGYTRILERWVRRAPEQYFWHHRRWKHQRPGTPPELGEP
ncbi:MAG: lysophospholipid acyltransferase family protein [Gemmatimonadaceae bacterium]